MHNQDRNPTPANGLEPKVDIDLQRQWRTIDRPELSVTIFNECVPSIWTCEMDKVSRFNILFDFQNCILTIVCYSSGEFIVGKGIGEGTASRNNWTVLDCGTLFIRSYWWLTCVCMSR